MGLKNPGLEAGHPKQRYFELVKGGETVNWFTDRVDAKDLCDYVITELLDLPAEELISVDSSSARDREGTLSMAGVAHGSGAVLTVTAHEQAAVHRINRAISVQHETIVARFRAGESAGMATQCHNVILNFGMPSDSSDWKDLYLIMNEGDVVDLAPWCQATEATEESPPEVGLSRSLLEMVLNVSPEVQEYSSASEGMWKATVKVDDSPPCEMLVDNTLNEIYLQLLVPVDAEHVIELMESVTEYATVGVSLLGGNFYLRSGAFMQFTSYVGVNNMLRAIALAHGAFVQKLGEKPPSE